MNTSLRAISPQLAEILGEKETTLRERQRALVQARLLQSLPGRGRGAGVVATPESVAILLMSLLASVTLVDAAENTSALMGADALRACPLSGRRSFGEALSVVLSEPKLAERVTFIKATQANTLAQILYDADRKTVFVGKTVPHGNIFTERWVKGETLQEIARLLAKELAS